MIAVSGEIAKGDDERLARALRLPYDEVWFHSGGGSIFTAMRMGEALRGQNAVTRVPSGARCASACAYAFIGGRIRYVEANAQVGVHMTTMAYDEKTQEFVQRLVREGSKEAIHVAISKVEQFAAYAAASQAEYRVKMGVSLKLMKPNILTDNWEMYWLSSEELRSFNVVNAAN